MTNQETQTYRYQCKLCGSALQPTSGLSQCACGAVGVDVLDAASGMVRLLGEPQNVTSLDEQVDFDTGKITKDS